MESIIDDEIDLMLVDDERDILELSELALNKQNSDYNIETTTEPSQVIEEIQDSNLDAILSDYNMPQMTGIELLEEVRGIDEDLPFILYTGAGTEEIAEKAINAGITDYFRKEAGLEHYGFISNSIDNSVEKYRDLERAEILNTVVEGSINPIIVTDTESNIVYVNQALEDVSEYSREELIGQNPNILSSGKHTEEEFQKMYNALNNGETVKFDGMVNSKKSGENYVHDQEIIPICVHNSQPDYFAGISKLKVD